MITEQGKVTRIDGRHAWVSCQSRAACPRCAEGRGCGGGLIGLMLGTRLHEVRVLRTKPGIAVGQCVSLGLRESVLLKYAFATYVLPLLTMMVLAVLVAGVAPESNEMILVAAVFGLAVGFVGLRWLSGRWTGDPAMQPVILS